MQRSTMNVHGLSPDPAAGDPLGAVWRRWEPHIHTPGTALKDQYGVATLDDFLTAVEEATPAVEVLAVTDYLLTRRYKEILARRAEGRLADVAMLFCNIEVRLTIETKAGSGVNLHLLVSPDDPEHVEQLDRFLSRLQFHFEGDNFACTEGDLRRLGRAHDTSIFDDDKALQSGVNQFKVDFHALRKLYEETDWARANILIAVAGSSNDGTAGLQDQTASFAATRKEMEAFAHIIFTVTPKNIEFWRGEGVLTEADLDAKYNGPKPCLHGSDAHSLDEVAKPKLDRICWIKGDPSFETLRQACMEPRLRAHIGPLPPSTDTPFSIDTVATPALPWLVPDAMPINPGMVAIIGARGSGKTALADLIAHAGDSPFPTQGDQSFINRARPFIGSGQVEATWSGADASSRILLQTPDNMAEVHYLTQQFVDRLCSSVGQSDELLDEIKRVVFLAHEPASRLGADRFDALADLRSGETQLAVEALNQRLDRLSQEILVERTWYLKQADLHKDLSQIGEELGKTEKAQQDLIKPGGKERADYYTRLGTGITNREQALQALGRQLQSYRKLGSDGRRYETEVFPQLLDDLKRTHGVSLLAEVEWSQFAIKFSGTPQNVVADKIAFLELEVTKTTDRDGLSPSQPMNSGDFEKCSLLELKSAQTEVGAQIGVDNKNVQRLQQLNDLHATHTTKQQRLTEELARAQESPTRLGEHLAERASLYERFFELIVEQSSILTDLYQPLATKLSAQSTSAQKLSLRVVREIDIEAWGRAGEDLLDLRKVGTFRGRGSIEQIARADLLTAWQDGSAADVAAAMETFRATHDSEFLAQASVDRDQPEFQQWVIELGRWLYSTDHIRVEYSIEYEGVPITQLSPGTRGIVLLLLYLALDLEDSRPLIIDQPEENLDPKSVFTELVALFRAARLRRQIIIVTHNANLVVNADVDQVIVASCVKPESTGLVAG